MPKIGYSVVSIRSRVLSIVYRMVRIVCFVLGVLVVGVSYLGYGVWVGPGVCGGWLCSMGEAELGAAAKNVP